MTDDTLSRTGVLNRITDGWRTFREYVGMKRWRGHDVIEDRAGLRHFLETRASFLAQTSLYGYLRTRAGQRYPELFDDDGFVGSINIAKWHVWLACLSDITVYAGGLLVMRQPEATAMVGGLMSGILEEILEATGVPDEAGPEFAAHADRVRARIRHCDWTQVMDDESTFSESPPALVRWAPIVDSLKELDEPIVMNSVRFRWQEVRRDLRRDLRAAGVLQHPD